MIWIYSKLYYPTSSLKNSKLGNQYKSHQIAPSHAQIFKMSFTIPQSVPRSEYIQHYTTQPPLENSKTSHQYKNHQILFQKLQNEPLSPSISPPIPVIPCLFIFVFLRKSFIPSLVFSSRKNISVIFFVRLSKEKIKSGNFFLES